MLTFDHWNLEVSLIPLVLIALATWLWRAVRAKTRWVRVSGGALVVLLAIVAVPLLIFVGIGLIWTSSTQTSDRLYSPDRKHVILVRDWDAGALGGTTTVQLYSYSGLLETVIAGGEWKEIELQNVRWTSNSEVEMFYDTSYQRPPNCSSTRAISVLCKPLP